MKLLLFRDKKVFLLFTQLNLISFNIGLARLLLPFQIIELGGGENLVSLTSVLYAVGQIIGISIVSAMCEKRQSECIVVILFWMLSLISLVIPFVISLVISRFFEGLGYGLLLVGILNFADNNYDKNKGEAVGTVFGSIFFGGAIGQGLAGFLEENIKSISQTVKISAFQILMFIAIGISAISLIIAILNYKPENKINLFEIDKIAIPHLHMKDIKNIFKFIPFTLLFLIYALYDFSHGIYTPNLPLVLASHGINKIHISIIFFTGDAIWGLSQIFTGRLADKLGSWLPMFLSMIIKGLGVLGYNQFYWWISVLSLFIIVGIGESLMEPARNIAILDIETHFDKETSENNVRHNHKHLNISLCRKEGFSMGIHAHLHEHKPSKESIVMGLQLTGIIAFGLGGVVGSSILTLGGTAELLVYIGAIVLLVTALIALLGKILEKNSNQEKDVSDKT